MSLLCFFNCTIDSISVNSPFWPPKYYEASLVCVCVCVCVCVFVCVCVYVCVLKIWHQYIQGV